MLVKNKSAYNDSHQTRLGLCFLDNALEMAYDRVVEIWLSFEKNECLCVRGIAWTSIDQGAHIPYVPNQNDDGVSIKDGTNCLHPIESRYPIREPDKVKPHIYAVKSACWELHHPKQRVLLLSLAG